MFDETAFQSWSLIILGATIFASLFLVIVLAAQQLFEGDVYFARAAVGIGGGAFAGYVGTAWLIRREM